MKNMMIAKIQKVGQKMLIDNIHKTLNNSVKKIVNQEYNGNIQKFNQNYNIEILGCWEKGLDYFIIIKSAPIDNKYLFPLKGFQGF